MRSNSIRFFFAAGSAAALAIAAPALADVKAGVDAWSEGNYAEAVRQWTQPAAAGDADAQFNLAQAYRLGRGVETNLVQAEALYARAAAQGHVRAADQYGLMLFQKGERERAMPYVEAAASRGDPRSQYLLGIAHFNGDLAAKDWPRAYALLTLANATGLPQARGALAQMDEYIPMEQREEAQALAASIKQESEANRARELAAVDLATVGIVPENAALIGSDFAQASPAPAPAPASAPAPVPVRAAPVPQPQPASVRPVTSGPWKVQLGAFGVPGNAAKLWNKLSGRPEIAGRDKIEKKAGALTILLAGGYASRAEAAAACSALKRSGQDCLVTK